MALTHTEPNTSEALARRPKRQSDVSVQQSETLTDRDRNGDIPTLEIEFGDYRIVLPVIEVQWFLDGVDEILRLTQLKTGWDGDDARPVSIESLYTATRLLAYVVNKNTPSPYIFPLPDGGIQFEWHTEEIDLEIGLSGNSEVVVLYRGPDNIATAWESRLIEAVSRLKEYIQQLS
jgi:hypothetical protein